MSDRSQPITVGPVDGALYSPKEYTGFIAFFDILGFSELIIEENFSDKIETYRTILNDAIRVDASDLEYVFFSDSVIINSQSNEEEELLQIIVAISEISCRLLDELGLAICGCISYGTFTKLTDQEKNVMITGKPILDAIHYEKEQNWAGVMVSPRVLKHFPKLKDKIILDANSVENVEIMVDNILWLPCLTQYMEIPFSDDRIYEGFVITPKNRNAATITDFISSLDNYKKKLKETKLLAPDDYTQKKYEYTMKLIDKMKNNWESIEQTQDTQPLFDINYLVSWDDTIK